MSAGIVKDVWLTLLADGGYSTLTEVKVAVEGTRIDRILNALADQGCCVRVPDPGRKNGVRFGVTPSCKVPLGVSLQEIQQASEAA